LNAPSSEPTPEELEVLRLRSGRMDNMDDFAEILGREKKGGRD